MPQLLGLSRNKFPFLPGLALKLWCLMPCASWKMPTRGRVVVLDLCPQQDLAIKLGGVKPWCGELTLLVDFPPGLACSCRPCLFREGAGALTCQSSSSFIKPGAAPAFLSRRGYRPGEAARDWAGRLKSTRGRDQKGSSLRWDQGPVAHLGHASPMAGLTWISTGCPQGHSYWLQF